MSQYPVREWSSGRIWATVVAGLIPFIIVFGNFYLRMPRIWMRCEKSTCERPADWLMWAGLFLMSLVWVLLGISLPIGLDGVSGEWWILPIFNIVVSLLPFLLPLKTNLAIRVVALLLGAGTLIQYAAAQRSWIAAVCTIPYILLCLTELWMSSRPCKTRSMKHSCRTRVK